jgi:hypothetical protein
VTATPPRLCRGRLWCVSSRRPLLKRILVVVEPPAAVEDDCGAGRAAAADESGRFSRLQRRRPLLRTIVVTATPPLPCARVRRPPSGLPPNAKALAAPLAGVVRATRGGTNPLPANARAAASGLWKERATDRGRRALAGESRPG